MALKIGFYIGSWPQNIGNAFFDLGAQALMRAAFPDASFYNMGGAVHWMFEASRAHHAHAKMQKIKKIFDASASPLRAGGSSFEIAEFAEIDLLVYAGMSMCDEFIANNGKTFFSAAERGVPILGLGTGAAEYTEKEADNYAAFLRALGKVAVITRDDDTFRLFANKVARIAAGIDCAFALPMYYTPPRLALPAYDIVNFDGVPIPGHIDHQQRKVLYTHHNCWGILSKEYISKPDTLVSDVPEDYLTLYSQAVETHSSRVHACVAALAYGNKARLYATTPRKALFKKVGAESVFSEPTDLDQTMLGRLRDKQIALIRESVGFLLE